MIPIPDEKLNKKLYLLGRIDLIRKVEEAEDILKTAVDWARPFTPEWKYKAEAFLKRLRS